MKTILLLLVSLGVCFFFFNNTDEQIRIRVISNSNSNEDLNYKNEVVKFLKEDVLENIKLTDQYFSENYKEIEKTLNTKFSNITVLYQNHNFKNKTYNDNALENASYKTLLVCIGEAGGSNWWGSIFEESLQYESTDEVIYEWYFKKEHNGE